MSSNVTIPTYITLVSGSVAAIGSTFVKQPLDRLKWLRQVSEGQSNITQSSYLNVFRSILRIEGVLGLFRGVTAAISRNIPHAALIYTLFPKLRNEIIYTVDINGYSIKESFINCLAGATASIIVTFITHPGDTLRVRYTVQYSSLRYNSYPQLMQSMLNEGVTSFYRGLFVSCIGTTIRGGVGFGVYETLKSDEAKMWHVQHPVFERFSIGYIAGAASTVTSYPADTVRRRMQVWGTARSLTDIEAQHFGQILPQYIKNARSLFIHIAQTEGIKGYFKGLGVTMIKTPISTSVSLTLNDLAKKYIFDVNA